MLIRLEYQGSIIHETEVAEITGELTIGRNQSCDWKIPSDDKVASSKHAALFVKSGKPWIKDLGSTNGTYFKGKAIPKKMLEIGDRISIGDCILAVDEPSGGNGDREPSRLLLVNGPQKGKKYDLTPPKFTIGSDPACNLVLLDMLISKNHADIEVKEDDSCWITDLGSKNGSSVNGMPLRSDQERMLKDGDRIAIAQFEMIFQDGAVKHGNSQVWLRLGVIVATLVVVLVGYWGYQQMRPSSEDLLRQARIEAAAGNFAAARALLEEAATARQAAHSEVARTDLLRNLNNWENTAGTWAQAQGQLTEGNWVEAARGLGLLSAGRSEIWTWSEAAGTERDKAMLAKEMLDALTGAMAILQRDNAELAELNHHARAVEQALRLAPEEPPPHLARLQEALHENQSLMTTLLAGHRELDQTLRQIATEDPPYREIIAAIESLGQNSHPHLRRRTEVLLEPTKALAASAEALALKRQTLREMEFDRALAVAPRIPSLEACAVDPRLSDQRQRLIDRFVRTDNQIRQISFFHGEIVRDFGPVDRLPPPLEVLRQPATMERVFACDSLRSRLPGRGRTAPEGAYDSVLGIEEFYEFLNALPEPFDIAMADLPFPSSLAQARLGLNRINRFLVYMAEPTNQPLRQGRLGLAVEHCEAIVKTRDQIVDSMIAKAEASSGREALIAAGIALRLTDHPERLRCQGQPLAEWVAEKFGGLRQQMHTLNSEYSRSMPQRQIEIREQVLQIGLPGDPVVRRMWAARDAAVGN